jgi:hypothetical protein
MRISSFKDAPLTTSAALLPMPGVMRISRGPSCTKLKPRDGVVELRRGDSQVEQNAVELEARFDLIRTFGQGRKPRVEYRHSRIGREARPGIADGRNHGRGTANDR